MQSPLLKKQSLEGNIYIDILIYMYIDILINILPGFLQKVIMNKYNLISLDQPRAFRANYYVEC